MKRRSTNQRRTLLPTLFAAASLSWVATAIAFANESTATAIGLGSKFNATDTLACGDESNDDAKACLANLSWKPTKFVVELEATEPGYGDYLVRFPSPQPIGNSTNDRVAMEWYAARDKEKKIRKAPAIVVVHESGRRMTVGRLMARNLSMQGLHAFLIQLPGYGARRVEGFSDTSKALSSIPQAIADVRRARDAVVALPMVDHSVVGLQGTSLGGFVTATVAGLDHGYDRVFILLAGGNLQDVLFHDSREAKKAREKLVAAGLTEDQMKELVHEVEPLRLAHRINPAGTWLYSGQYDNIVPPSCSLALAKAAHLPEGHHIEFLADHFSGIIYLPQVVQQISQRMTAPLAEQHTIKAAN